MASSRAEPPKKLARATQQKHLERDQEFWYKDGTIILIAGDIEFRVYRGPLERHSPVFSDMLSMPQPPESGNKDKEKNKENGCPIIPLSDSPQELRHLLRAVAIGDSLK